MNETPSTFVQGELRLAGMLDERLVTLLRAIECCGSLNQAAKQVGLSYKGAWQILERANNLAPKALLSTSTGGSKGGGTLLTESGKQLLQLFDSLQQQHQAFLQQLNAQLFNNTEYFLLLKPLSIKTSATNQLFGTVLAIQPGAVQTEVAMGLKDGTRMIACITHAELQGLLLKADDAVVIMINAHDIMLREETGEAIFSACNTVPGTVIRIQQDPVDSLVVLRLEGGDTLCANLTLQSIQALGLAVGTRINAVINSHSLMLGVAV